MKVKLRKGNEYIEVDSEFSIDEIEVFDKYEDEKLEDTLEFDISNFGEEQ